MGEQQRADLAEDSALGLPRGAELAELLERASRGENVGVDLAAAQIAATPAHEWEAQERAYEALSKEDRAVLAGNPDAGVYWDAYVRDPEKLARMPHGELREFVERAIAAKRNFNMHLAIARRRIGRSLSGRPSPRRVVLRRARVGGRAREHHGPRRRVTTDARGKPRKSGDDADPHDDVTAPARRTAS